MKLLLRNGLLVVAACLAIATAAEAAVHTRYEVINVSPPGVQSAEGMSVGGSVVGFATYSSQRTRGFYWSDNSGDNPVNDVGTLGGQNSRVLDISNGYLAGSAQNAAGEYRAFYKYSSTSTMNELQMLPGYTASQANETQFIVRQIVGSMTGPSLGTHAALWTNELSPPIDLGADAEALAINRSGLVAGRMGGQAVRWDSSGSLTPLFLGTLGGSTSVATAVQRYSSNITGYSKVSGDAATHAFLWDGASMTDLGTLPGMTDSFAYGIDPMSLQVVGESSGNGVSRAFLWENGVMNDLNTLIPADSGWELLTARDTNGTITGAGIYQGKRQAFLLKPPAPPAVTAVLSGTQGCNSYYTTPVTVTLAAAASQNVGIQEIRYSINSAPYVSVPGDSAVINLDTQGNYTINYYAVDNGGLVGNTNPISIAIDWTAPTSTMWISSGIMGYNGWYRSDVTMAISYDDPARPLRFYSIDGGVYASLVGPNNSFAVTGSGSHFIDYYTEDYACNAEPVKRFGPVPIDMIAPEVTVGTSPSTLRSSTTSKLVNLTITGTATDATSGVETVSVSVVDEYGEKNYNNLIIGSVIQVDTYKQKTDKNGRIYTITALAADKAGNQKTATTILSIK